jgi:amino acid adenylation domain-containing protein/thioester reductase-like protein
MPDLPLPTGGDPAGIARNPDVREFPDDRSVADLFTEQARRSPEAVAISAGEGPGAEVTYRELDAWSNRLAARLVEGGVAAGEPVGLLGGRCAEAPAGMLAIMKAGGAYVPLDGDDPMPRLHVLVNELGIRRIITMPGYDEGLAGIPALPAEGCRRGPDPGRPAPRLGGGDRAYVLFTSGSTGEPNAVAVPHRAVARLVINTNYVRFGPGDRVANTGHPSFDASIFEIWGALLNGARLVIVNTQTLLDPAALEDFLRREGITILWLTAGVFHYSARARPGMFSSVRYLISGGDVLIPEIVAEVLRAGRPAHLVNGYGPTENTTFSATYEITDVPAGTARIPIGTPVANSTCHVLAADGSLAADGEEGELAVGGDGVALGYLNSAVLTAERFIPDPFGRRGGARLFRTGDHVRWLPDGNLDFLGRRDRMIKLHGFRVELDEVEAALSGCPLVARAAVGAVGTDAFTRAIVAYYTDPPGSHTGPRTAQGLRQYLAQRLPSYMLPGRFIRLDHFPLTPAGKLDRVALAAAGAAATVPARRSEVAAGPVQGGLVQVGPVQLGLARLWGEILDVPHVRPDDDFFDLGGNSLLAAQVFARLQTLFGVGLEQSRFLTARLLADASLAACAEAVRQARGLTRLPAGGEPDFRRESDLDVPLPVTGRAGAGGRTAGRPPGTILLTGGSGFLGSYLLRELIESTDAQIHCLVRADDRAHALRRLAGAQARYRLGDLPDGRVVPLQGDLARPLLGLSEAEFDAAARSVDLVLHAGAFVNFTYPYDHVASVTVAGTKEIIALAARHRGAPIHFVSSLAVLAGFGAAGVRAVSEDDPLEYPDYLYLGYSEAKWVTEVLLGHVARAGLPAAVYRPYEISGALRLGAWNLESATCALFRVMADTGCAPDIDLPLDFVPVDVLARQIVHIACSRPARSRTYHLANPRPATLLDMTGRLAAHGYPVNLVPLETWLAEAVRCACDQPGHPFAPFIPLWIDRSPRSGLTVKEMFFASHFPSFSTSNAQAALAGADIEIPPVDAAMLDSYIRFYRRAGFLPEPGGPAQPRPEADPVGATDHGGWR